MHQPILPGATETCLNGCESIDTSPDNNEEWAAFCYCTEADDTFTKCISDWNDWSRNR